MPLPSNAPDYELAPVYFPIFIDAPAGDEVVSIMSISRSFQTGGVNTETSLDNSDILLLVNPSFDFFTTSDSRSSVQIYHPWAKDVEGSASRVVKLDFDSLTFQRANSDYFVYTGYLMRMAFYMPGVDNIFTHATEEEVTEEEYDANWEYPYLPPRVSISGVNLPLKVEIAIGFGSSVAMENQRSQIRDS